MITDSGRSIFAATGALALLFLRCSLLGGQPSGDGPSALTNWMVAQAAFQKAGGLINQAAFEPARKALNAAAVSLPVPYNSMAQEFAGRLEKVTNQPQSDSRIDQCVKLCADLQDYSSAIKLIASQRAGAKTEEGSEVPAWYFVETGDLKAALADYERQQREELVETYRDYFGEQIRLIRCRITNKFDVNLSLQFVEEHYLKGLERKGDMFGALRELRGALLCAHTPHDRAAVYRKIIKCLGALGDEAGRDAWEEKLLGDVKTETEACARVYYERGLRALQKKEYAAALDCFNYISSSLPDSMVYGDALYGTGLVFQEQAKYDEAVKAYERLFPSKVSDYLIDPEGAEDYKSYRFRGAMRVSECYEAKKDYRSALEYALAARDRYPFISFCSNCLKNTAETLNKRIARLQALADKQGN